MENPIIFGPDMASKRYLPFRGHICAENYEIYHLVYITGPKVAEFKVLVVISRSKVNGFNV